MKVLFGEVSKDHMDGSSFADAKGKEFYFSLDIHEEHDGEGTLVITDTCNRFMPMDFDQLDELVEILTVLQEYRNDRIIFENHWKRIWAGQ